MKPGEIITKRRKELGIELQEVADRAGISVAAYRGLESFDDLVEGCTVKTYIDVCRVLGLHVLDPFQTAIPEIVPMELSEFYQAIREHIKSQSIAAEKFTENSGWDPYYLLNLEETSSFIDSVPLMAIQDVCRIVGLDWRSVLLGLSGGGA